MGCCANNGISSNKAYSELVVIEQFDPDWGVQRCGLLGLWGFLHVQLDVAPNQHPMCRISVLNDFNGACVHGRWRRDGRFSISTRHPL